MITRPWDSVIILLCINMNWNLVKKLCLVPLALLALAVGTDILIFTLVEYGRKEASFVGCYGYDAMLVGFECKGFRGGSLVSAWLNWPLWLLYGPMFMFFSIRSFVVAVLAWSPLAFFVLSTIRLSKRYNA